MKNSSERFPHEFEAPGLEEELPRPQRSEGPGVLMEFWLEKNGRRMKKVIDRVTQEPIRTVRPAW